MSRDACLNLYRQNVASDDTALDIEGAFNAVTANLENDFYINYNAKSEHYEFACKVLRDWWLRHYGLETA